MEKDELVTQMEDLKIKLEKLSADRSKAEGKLEQVIEEIKKKGFKDFESVTAKLNELREEYVKSKETNAEMLEELMEKYEEFLK